MRARFLSRVGVGGHPVWVELTGSDLDASAALYGAVFGWTRARYNPDTFDFSLGDRHPRVPEAPCWLKLHTKDFAAAVPLYERVFGVGLRGE